MAAAEGSLWGIPGSVSNPDTLGQIKGFVENIGLTGIKELNDAMGTLRSVTNKIHADIDARIANNADDPNSPIILMINYPPGPNLPRHDPRDFVIGDYVIVYRNNEATAINTSAAQGIYRVKDINDDMVTVDPAIIGASPVDLPADPVDLQNSKIIPKNRCALLRKYNGRLILLCIDHNPSSGGPSSGGAKSSRRRRRRSSRSKSVNKKRKYTQRRVRRSRRR